jgi:hypothetical protein
MTTDFFKLSRTDQRNVIVAISQQKAMPAAIVEKDLWLCLVLDNLFQLPLSMSFKGGTSLSKVFGLIDRFSEDIDITIDYHNVFPDMDLSKPTSNTALKKLSDQLKLKLRPIVEQQILPHLSTALAAKLPNQQFEITLSESGEELEIYYDSLLGKDGYLRDHILIEFGIRNSIEPSEVHQIQGMGADVIDQVSFPKATVKVLAPTRTFWEKATLIHVECNRGRLSDSPERLSRHWYDLTKLYNSWVGEAALTNIQLLKDVIVHKKAFFNASYAHYDDCLRHQFKLLPDKSHIQGLKVDYQKMLNAGMLAKTPPRFEEIIFQLRKLEANINKLAT